MLMSYCDHGPMKIAELDLLALFQSSYVMTMLIYSIVDVTSLCWLTMYSYLMYQPMIFHSIDYIVVPTDRIYSKLMMNMDLSHPNPLECTMDSGTKMDY